MMSTMEGRMRAAAGAGGMLWVLQNTSSMDTAAAAESPCSDATRARVLDPDTLDQSGASVITLDQLETSLISHWPVLR